MSRHPRGLPRRSLAASAIVLLITIGTFGLPQPARGTGADLAELPDPLGYVSDYAGVLDVGWKSRIRSVCQDLERKTGIEMVVVTVKDLGRYRTARRYAEALYRGWGIGTAQQDHGVLVFAVPDRKESAVTVGRSLGMVITPEALAKVSSQTLDPFFNRDQYGEGLYQLTVGLASSVQDIRVGNNPRTRARGVAVFLMSVTGVGAVVFLWWITRPDLHHPFQRLRRGEYWASGQGGFRGNFGGFGGGTSGEGLS